MLALVIWATFGDANELNECWHHRAIQGLIFDDTNELWPNYTDDVLLHYCLLIVTHPYKLAHSIAIPIHTIHMTIQKISQGMELVMLCGLPVLCVDIEQRML
jgi:hypothetical protein